MLSDRPSGPPLTRPNRTALRITQRCSLGGPVSPVLSNIYLHKLDEFVETVLIPKYTQGASRKRNPAYIRVRSRLAYARRCGRRARVRQLRRQLRDLPVGDPKDPGFRRLRYSRYADDHLLGFIGPKAEAEEIKDQLARFLRGELALELNADKTLITHARTRAARYLGYEIIVQHGDSKITKGQRSVNGKIALRVPLDVIRAKRAPYRRHGKAWHRPAMQNLDDYDIVKTYAAEYRGIVQYYLLANDVWRFNRLRWDAQTSMLKTLAAKHQSSVVKMAAKHTAKIATPHGLRTCFEARVERDGKQPLVARFGGIPLIRNKDAVLTDRVPSGFPTPARSWSSGSARAGASCAGKPARCWCTRSGASPASASPARASPPGRHSWPGSGARPSWSAAPATTPSTRAARRHRGVDHWRATCRENWPAWFGGRPRGKGPAHRRAPRRAAHPVERRLVLLHRRRPRRRGLGP